MQCVPTSLAELARKHHVIHSFFNVLSAEETSEVITDVVVPSTEHVTCVEPVMEQQPSEDFDLHSTTGFPEVLKSRVCVCIMEIVGVVILRPEFSCTPDVVPNISEGRGRGKPG